MPVPLVEFVLALFAGALVVLLIAARRVDIAAVADRKPKKKS
jgi:hypothetical protein